MRILGWISRHLLITMVIVGLAIIVAAACSQQLDPPPTLSMPTPTRPSEATGGAGQTPPVLPPTPTASQPATPRATQAGVPPSSPTPTRGAQIKSLTRVDDGQRSITVEVTWVTPSHLQQLPQAELTAYPIDNNVLLHVKLDTHSVDISRYDLAQIATLRGSSGPATAPTWVGIADSGHHREGVLVFPGQGSEQWMSKEGKSELVLSGIGGVAQRTFTWEF